MKNLSIITAALILSALSTQAAEMTYSFNVTGEEVEYFGTGKKETYDIAVCINNPFLTGAKITGLTVALPGESEWYEAPSAFLTTELKVERVDGVRVNVPDICSVEGKIENGVLSATFEEPYTITTEPVYLGYSFQIKELRQENKEPVAVVSGKNPDGLWFHSSKTTLKWSNYVDRTSKGMQSAMSIFLEGDFPSESVTLTLPEKSIFKTGENAEFKFQVSNVGSSEINSIEYKWTLDGNSSEGNYNFKTPVENALGATREIHVSLPAIDTNGEYIIGMEITKVNGKENLNNTKVAEGKVIFTPIVPVALPLVDEYTGLWCGYCPRGYAALEYMKEKHGYDFVAAAWHAGERKGLDPMCITYDFPNVFSGFPNAFINRKDNMDPGYIVESWERYYNVPVNYSITCTVELTGEDKSSITANTKVLSIEDSNTPLTIGYVLVGDELSNPSWEQTNYFAGNLPMAQREMPGEWGEFFASAGSKVTGLVFNDVVLSHEYSVGVMNSLPEEMKAFEIYDHQVTFELNDIVEYDTKKPIEFNPEKLRVLAFILNSERNVVNACSSAYPGEPAPSAAVENIENDSTILSTVWYDLQGHQTVNPEGGIYIRIDSLSNGNIKASKQIIH